MTYMIVENLIFQVKVLFRYRFLHCYNYHIWEMGRQCSDADRNIKGLVDW